MYGPSVRDASSWKIVLPDGRVDQTSESDKHIRLCRLKNLPLESNQPVVVDLCLVVSTNGSWGVFA